MSRPPTGRTWMVTSRDTSDCHSLAAERTRIAPAVVSEARNVMIATTATSARPAMVEGGTIGVSERGRGIAMLAAARALPRLAPAGGTASFVDMQPALVQ